jgi:2-methylisocitrate lyase-like PEP mutase family enzyme
VIPWGDAETVAERIRAHLDAGADHVCIQVVSDLNDFPMDAYRALAEQLL